MKKWLAMFLTLALAMSLTACGCQKKPTTDPTGTTGRQDAGKNLTGSMVEVVNQIMEQNPAQFMGMATALDLQDTSEEGLWALTGYTGLDSPGQITDAAVYEPMTGSQAFSLVLVRVADSADPKAVARQMKENINPRKWICAVADQIITAGYGNVVMFIMLDSQLGLTAQSYVDAFQRICGSKPDFTL